MSPRSEVSDGVIEQLRPDTGINTLCVGMPGKPHLHPTLPVVSLSLMGRWSSVGRRRSVWLRASRNLDVLAAAMSINEEIGRLHGRSPMDQSEVSAIARSVDRKRCPNGCIAQPAAPAEPAEKPCRPASSAAFGRKRLSRAVSKINPLCPKLPRQLLQVYGLDLRHVRLALDDWGKLQGLQLLPFQGQARAVVVVYADHV